MKTITKKVNQIDNYHGVNVADPYRWLEDPDSIETQEWIAEQNQMTQQYLAGYPGEKWSRKILLI